MLKFCATHVCAKYRKNIGTKGSYMSFEACESRILMHSVPLPRFGILGAVGVVILYFIVNQFDRCSLVGHQFQFQLFQLFI